MKITAGQLRQIIREEILREYDIGSPTGSEYDTDANRPSQKQAKEPKKGYKYMGSVVVWNNTKAKPVSNQIRNALGSKSLLGKVAKRLVDKIPQGHAGVILISPQRDAYVLDFGAGPIWGCSDKVSRWRTTYGVLAQGGYRLQKIGKAKIERGQISSEEALRLVKKSKISRKANEIGVADRIDFDAAFSWATAEKCRLYNLIPSAAAAGAIPGDNCGSWTAKVVARGAKKSPTFSPFVMAPDSVIEDLLDYNLLDRRVL